MKTRLLLLCGLLLLLPVAQGAATLEYVYAFTNGPAHPYAGLVKGSDGNFYGTSYSGGKSGLAGDGTVFKVTTNGDLTMLASFFGTNGVNPRGTLVEGDDGNFYGTTAGGGASADGTVFKVTTNGTLTTLVTFNGANGRSPYAGLVKGSDGNFYGTTYYGGPNNYGTVFRMTTNGTLTTLVSFNQDFVNGYWPRCALVEGDDGAFYGTTEMGGPLFPTQGGGTTVHGTVFKVTTNGTLTTLVQFNGTNGSRPFGGLVKGSDGKFYGTTTSTDEGGVGDNGTVFKMTTNGVLTTLAFFTGPNGASPQSKLTEGSDGNFYGTTRSGGSDNQGTVFKVTTNGALTVLASFINSPNGQGTQPLGELIEDTDGYFYGTASAGSPRGSVFKVRTNAMLTAVALLRNVSGTGPQSGVVQGTDGNFYGTTAGLGLGGDGLYGGGTLFKLTPGGALTSLVSFDSTNGSNPKGRLIQGSSGELYGVTEQGGANTFGTVYKVTTNGTWTTLVTFNDSNGRNPGYGLVEGSDGNFYGTTSSGGAYGYGTIFKMTPGGALTTLYHSTPMAGFGENLQILIEGSDGNLYGTASDWPNPYGQLIKMTHGGSLTTLASFGGTNGNAMSQTSLIEGSDGNFYGTTFSGGTWDHGVVFKVTSNGTLTALTHFLSSSNGSAPWGKLVEVGSGTFYGTTLGGGPNGFNGTVFKVTTDGTLTTMVSFLNAREQYPEGLIRASDGRLYGTCLFYGSAGGGSVFRVSIVDPEITTQPASRTNNVGTLATFTTTVDGTMPLTYYWRKDEVTLANGGNVSGADSATLSLSNVQLGDGGGYSVVVSNSFGATTSLVATLTINRVPVITSAPTLLTTSEDVPIPFTVAASDLDSDPLSHTSTALHGSVSGTLPNLTYTPVANYNGADTITVPISDGRGGTAQTNIPVTVVSLPDAPVGGNQSINLLPGTSSPVTLTATDAEGGPLTYRVLSGPSHGTLTGTAPNFTYTPDAGYVGPDSFTFLVTDSTGRSGVGVISMTVSGTVTYCTGNLIQNPGFESGTANWYNYGVGVTLSALTSPVHSGAKALHVTGRTATWHGAAQNLLGVLQHSSTYVFSAWVKVGSASSQNFKMTLAIVDGGGTRFQTVANLNGVVQSDGWRQICNAFTTTFIGTPTALTLYVEEPAAGVNYYLDDVEVRCVSAPNDGNLLRNGGFELGAQDWGGFPLEVVADPVHGEQRAIQSYNRTASNYGPIQDVTARVQSGSNYLFSAWVRMQSSTPQEIRAAFFGQDTANSFYYPAAVLNSIVESNGWMQLVGTYPLQVTGTLSNLICFVNQTAAGVNFFVDDARLTLWNGAHLAQESFNYPPDRSLAGQGNGPGFATTWNSETAFVVSSGSLAFPGLETAGGRLSLAAPPGLRSQTRSLVSPLGADGTTRYISFLVRPDAPLPSGVTKNINLIMNGSMGASLVVGKVGTNDLYSMETLGGSGPVPSTTHAAVDAVALLVLRCDFAAGNDTFRLYVNPAPGQPEPAGGVMKSDLNLGMAGSVTISGDLAFTMDELRIGDTFESVMPGMSEPVILQSPGNVTVVLDSPAVLSVLAAGAAPLGYQWRKDGLVLQDGGAVSGATTATLTIDPAALSDAGAYDVIVAASGGAMTSLAATLTVNRLPILATPASITTMEDTPQFFMASATDDDGDAVSYSLTALHGSVSGAAPNFTYAPTLNYAGPDTITVQANDGRGGIVQANIAVTVTPVPDAPVAGNQSVTPPPGMPTAISLSAFDGDDDTLTYRILGGPSHGGLSGAPPSLTYTPDAGYSGPDSFTFLVTDASGRNSVGVVSLNVTAGTPTLCPDNLVLNPGFESGTANWNTFPLGSGIGLIPVASPVHGGGLSLCVSNRAASSDGVSQNSMMSVLQTSNTYVFSAWVQGDSTTNDNFTLNLRITDGAGTKFPQVASRLAAQSNGWVQLYGGYPLIYTGAPTDVRLFVAGPEPGVKFYVDDVEARCITIPPDGNLLPNGGFELGALNWFSRTGGRVLPVNIPVHGGQWAIQSVHRTSANSGPAQNIQGLLQSGTTYLISAWVYVQTQNPTGQVMRTIVRRQDAAGTNFFTFTGLTGVKESDGWRQLTGTYHHLVTGGDTNIFFYFEGPETNTTYVVDDVRFTPWTGPLLVEESFNYLPGTTLPSQGNGPGFVQRWGSETSFVANAASLAYPGLATDGGSLSRITVSGAKTQSRTLVNPLGTAGTTRYVSFLLRPDSASLGGAWLGLILNGSTGTNLFVGKPGGTNTYGMENTGGTLRSASGVSAVAGSNVFLVLRCDFTAGLDGFTLHVNPTPGQPEPADTLIKSNMNVGTIGSISIQGSAAFSIDEFRIGDTFESVVPGACAPLILEQPADVATASAWPAVLSVSVAGAAPLGYQWRKDGLALSDGGAISGAHTASLVFNPVGESGAGLYDVIAAAGCNAITSAVATVTILTGSTDTDSDGMPDLWELAHNLNRLDPGDATLDSDSDGMTNRDEFMAGTDPQDPASRLMLEEVQIASGSLQFKLRCKVGKSYSIVCKNSLDDLTWTRFFDIEAEPAEIFRTLSIPLTGGSPRFYKAVTPKQP